MTDFRIWEYGGVWWILKRDGPVWLPFAGPYKRREGAERRVKKEMAA